MKIETQETEKIDEKTLSLQQKLALLRQVAIQSKGSMEPAALEHYTLRDQHGDYFFIDNQGHLRKTDIWGAPCRSKKKVEEEQKTAQSFGLEMDTPLISVELQYYDMILQRMIAVIEQELQQ